MRHVLLGAVLFVTGCAGTTSKMVASLYEVTPEQCASVQDDYIAALVDPAADPADLDRLSCQMNKCAAMTKMLDDGIDLGAAGNDGRTRASYAPAALGGQACG